jgi:carbamoyl-phosphate synthase large subunit
MVRVLVTGVGAVIGYGIVRSLKALPEEVEIIGMDIYADAVGQHWCDRFEQATPAAAAGYVASLVRLIDRHAVDLVIPGIEQDAARMSAEIVNLEPTGAKFALNDPDLMRVAADKWRMHARLASSGYDVIPTRTDGTFAELAQELGLPFLLKPRRSYASKGIVRIDSEEELRYWRARTGDNFMVQKIVGDDESEFTTAAFGLGDGTYTQSITFRRRLSGEGATAKAIVTRIPELDELVGRLTATFRPVGPTNFQFREHEGRFLLLEINPRISSSTSLRAAFGYNEAGMCIDYFLRGKVPAPRPLRAGRAVRYIEDMVFYDRDNR